MRSSASAVNGWQILRRQQFQPLRQMVQADGGVEGVVLREAMRPLAVEDVRDEIGVAAAERDDLAGLADAADRFVHKRLAGALGLGLGFGQGVLVAVGAEHVERVPRVRVLIDARELALDEIKAVAREEPAAS